MKKTYLLFLFSITLVLTGCVKAENSVILNKDGSGINSFFVGIPKDMLKDLESMGTTEVETDEKFEDFSKLEEHGYKMESVDDEEYKGIRMTKDFTDVNELLFPTEDGEDFYQPFTYEKESRDDGDVYVLKYKKDQTNTEEVEHAMDFNIVGDSLSTLFDITLTVDLPTEPKKHNADTINGTKLTWDLTKASSSDEEPFVELSAKDLEKSSSFFSFSNTSFVVLMTLLGTALAIGLIIFISRVVLP